MKKKTIIISPLDWGLGHAARCIPIIKHLQRKKYKIIIAGSGLSLKMLKNELPELEFETVPTKEIHYSKILPAFLKILMQFPTFIKNIWIEKKTANYLQKKHNPNFIISDNRYGFRSNNCPSYFITHQVSPLLPSMLSVFQSCFRLLHLKLIKNFDHICIPDFESENNLSGKLSHGFNLPQNVSYIKPLSRFSFVGKKREIARSAEILIVISGPEPQREIFFTKAIRQSQKLDKTVLILAGLPGKEINEKINKLTILNHLPTEQMKQQIIGAEYVVCRSGYSSIMDLTILKKKAALIPTPGQTEQGYLAKHLTNKKLFLSFRQNEFDLRQIDFEMQSFNPEFL